MHSLANMYTLVLMRHGKTGFEMLPADVGGYCHHLPSMLAFIWQIHLVDFFDRRLLFPNIVYQSIAWPFTSIKR